MYMYMYMYMYIVYNILCVHIILYYTMELLLIVFVITMVFAMRFLSPAPAYIHVECVSPLCGIVIRASLFN